MGSFSRCGSSCNQLIYVLSTRQIVRLPPPPPNIPRVQSLTRFSRQNRGGTLPALDNEYRFVVNDIGSTDLL
jgi:hypothetical protein